MIEIFAILDRHIGIVTLFTGILTALATFFAVILTSWQDREARKYEYKYKYYHDKLHEFAEVLNTIIKITQGLWVSEPSEKNNEFYCIIPINIFKIMEAKNNYKILTKINKKWECDSKVLKYFDDLIQIEFINKELLSKHDEWTNIQRNSKNLEKDAKDFENGFKSIKNYTDELTKLESVIDKKDILKRLKNIQKLIDKEFEVG